MPLRRILYRVLADARGHLMRAHLLSRTLAEAALAEAEVQLRRPRARPLLRPRTG
jgi:hypothetical protein